MTGYRVPVRLVNLLWSSLGIRKQQTCAPLLTNGGQCFLCFYLMLPARTLGKASATCKPC